MFIKNKFKVDVVVGVNLSSVKNYMKYWEQVIKILSNLNTEPNDFFV